ncbi:MAG TPA: nucleotidyltransferase family protein [Allosphingosinicella sp.]|nr:nucleotidyltransferase family protein [Allosphingosinicella sp.]
MTGARSLVRALRDPGSVGACDWNGLVSAARAEQLIGSLAFRMEGRKLPPRIEAIFAAARRDAAHVRTRTLWEAEMCRRALAPLGIPVVLMKGTAFHAAGLEASLGRSVGDLDILVPRESLPAVESALLDAGWERLKQAGGYDDVYYRRWMHELPPLIHKDRDRMIDVHHTILPLTARPRPDAAALIEGSVALDNGLRVLAPADMIVHAAAHLFADGDLAGGLRNLWDIDRLLREFDSVDFRRTLEERARLHQLAAPVGRALRLARRLYGTPVAAGRLTVADRLFEARLLARNSWGQERGKLLRFAFYLRGHLLRMPPLMLARHLWTKAAMR